MVKFSKTLESKVLYNRQIDEGIAKLRFSLTSTEVTHNSRR
jgi:hypothetical protein